MRRIATIGIVICLFSLVVCGCGKKTELSKEDIVAIQEIATTDQLLAKMIEQDRTSKENFEERFIPIAEHYSLLQSMKKTKIGELKSGITADKSEMLVSEEEGGAKLVVLFSGKTRQVHIVEATNDSIKTHAILSREIPRDDYFCSQNEHYIKEGKYVAWENRDKAIQCSLSQSLIEKSQNLEIFLKERNQESYKNSVLGNSVEGDVKIYHYEDKAFVLLSEENQHALFTAYPNGQFYVINFVGFFSDGYGLPSKDEENLVSAKEKATLVLNFEEIPINTSGKISTQSKGIFKVKNDILHMTPLGKRRMLKH